jgi:hypothetical protein
MLSLLGFINSRKTLEYTCANAFLKPSGVFFNILTLFEAFCKPAWAAPPRERLARHALELYFMDRLTNYF